jgi:hypothetical protein
MRAGWPSERGRHRVSWRKTGHDETRGYGDKTREWQMDTVMGLSTVEREDTDVSFRLTFHKARLRTPANRADFAETNVALVNDRWVHSSAGKSPDRLAPKTAKFLDALVNAAIGNEANKMYGCPAASIDSWQARCVKLGLLEKERGKTVLSHSSRSLFSKHKLELIAANRIACNDTMAWVLP